MGMFQSWPNGTDCKSVARASKVRILLPPPVAMYLGGDGEVARIVGGCSSMVEQQPSKLNTRVRFPSPAPKTISMA